MECRPRAQWFMELSPGRWNAGQGRSGHWRRCPRLGLPCWPGAIRRWSNLAWELTAPAQKIRPSRRGGTGPAGQGEGEVERGDGSRGGLAEGGPRRGGASRPGKGIPAQPEAAAWASREGRTPARRQGGPAGIKMLRPSRIKASKPAQAALSRPRRGYSGLGKI
jgi:hypothetical protein